MFGFSSFEVMLTHFPSACPLVDQTNPASVFLSLHREGTLGRQRKTNKPGNYAAPEDLFWPFSTEPLLSLLLPPLPYRTVSSDHLTRHLSRLIRFTRDIVCALEGFRISSSSGSLFRYSCHLFFTQSPVVSDDNKQYGSRRVRQRFQG